MKCQIVRKMTGVKGMFGLFNGHLSQRFFVHLITSSVGLLRDIITQFQPWGNRCIGTWQLRINKDLQITENLKVMLNLFQHLIHNKLKR